MKMKKYATITLSAVMLLSSCGVGNENAASGGFLGAHLGSILGSAIGGISGGPRGSDIGTLVGMAGGAVVGAAIGSVADNANRQQYSEYKAQRQAQRQAQQQEYQAPQTTSPADSGFDPQNGGDDVITFDGNDTAAAPAAANADNSSDCKMHSAELMAEEAGLPALEIRNVRYVGNGMTLSAGELAKVTVEVYNNSTSSLYGVQPAVVETTGNRHIFVSAPILIEKIAPGKGIRYTAMVKADRKLKDGTAHFKVFATEKASGSESGATEFDVSTSR